MRTTCSATAAALLLLPAGAGSAAPDPPTDGPAPLPAHCPTVHRGIPDDGLTTVTVLQPEAACTAGAPWTGWRCMTLQSDANVNNGISYAVEVRWNRAGLPVRGTFTWMSGSAATQFLRLLPGGLAQWTQDQLDTVDQVRAVEMRFLGSGTEAMPRNGYPNLSAVYADVLEYLVQAGIVTGAAGHFGNSGGGLMGAHALAHHRVDRLVDGMVFGGGPFWVDLEPVCTDPQSPFYADLGTRGRADSLNWTDQEGTTPCTAADPAPYPSYDCRSMLGGRARTTYPDLHLAVIVGTMDVNNPWLDASATEYLARVTAATETFDRPVTNHSVLTLQAGADAVLLRVRGIVDAVAGTPRTGPGGSPLRRSARLDPPSPNPAGYGTVVTYRTERPGHVLLRLHDVAGRRVATLIDGDRPAGPASVRWNGLDAAGRPVPAGAYFVRLETAGARQVRKITVVR